MEAEITTWHYVFKVINEIIAEPVIISTNKDLTDRHTLTTYEHMGMMDEFNLKN